MNATWRDVAYNVNPKEISSTQMFTDVLFYDDWF